jgi:hypothetical protein
MITGPGICGGTISKFNCLPMVGGTTSSGRVVVTTGKEGGVVLCFGWVLRIPCRGRFMWPLAVAGLGLRYLSINFSDRLGHPFRNPFRTAFRSVDIFGLHSDWWANLTPFAWVLVECVNNA